MRHKAAVKIDLPACDAVPSTISARADLFSLDIRSFTLPTFHHQDTKDKEARDGVLFLVSLCLGGCFLLRREGELQPGEEIERQCRVAQHFFIFLVQEVVYVPVDFEAADQAVRESAVQNPVALAVKQTLKAEFARIDAVVRLEV